MAGQPKPDPDVARGVGRALKQAYGSGDYLPGTAADAEFRALADKLNDVPAQYRRERVQ